MLAVGAFPVPAHADVGNFTVGGPYGGIVQDLAVDPTNPSVVYVATRSGIFRSVDRGASWTPATAGLQQLWVNAVAVDPSAPSTLVAGTQGGSTYRSTDAGTNWTSLGSAGPGYVVSLTTTAAGPGALYAGADAGGGVWKSSDGGATWAQILSGVQVFSVTADPVRAGRLYAATPDGVIRTTNDGAIWEPLDVGTGSVGNIAVDPADVDVLFAADRTVFRSTDGGDNWSPVGAGLEGNVYSVDASPSGSTVYAAGYASSGTFLARTDDAEAEDGGTWTPLTPVPGGGSVPVLEPLPGSPQSMLVGTFGHGVFATADGGSTFQDSNAGLSAGGVSALAFDPSDPQIAFAATLAGLFRTGDGGSSWSQAALPPIDSALPNRDQKVDAIAVEGGGPSTVYVSRTELGCNHTPDGAIVLTSTSGGNAWAAAASGLPAGGEARFLFVDPRTPGVALAGVSERCPTLLEPSFGGVYLTTDHGGSWNPIGPAGSGQEPVDAPVVGMAADPSTDTIVVAVGFAMECCPEERTQMFLSRDWGSTWSEVADPFGGSSGGSNVLGIGEGGALFAAAGPGVARSDDDGATWTMSQLHSFFSGNVGVTQVVQDPADPMQVLVGTDEEGLWLSTDGASTWAALTPGLRGLRAEAIVFPPPPLPTGGSAGRVDSAPPAAARFGATGAARGGMWTFSPAPHGLTEPTLTGSERVVGATLSCTPGTWSRATGVRVSWTRDGAPMAGTTGPTYRTRTADLHHAIGCAVRATGPGGAGRALTDSVGIEAGCLHVHAVRFDPPGADGASNSSLNKEWAEVHSTCGAARSLTGFRLRNKAGTTFTFPTFALAPGGTVRVHTGRGSSSTTHLFWRRTAPAWANTADTATILEPRGASVDACPYVRAGSGLAACHAF
jgi:Lamin Tail Domain